MGCLKKGIAITDIRTGRHAKSSHLGRTCIGNVIAVQVWQGQHAVFLGSQKDLLEHGIGNAVLYNNFALWLSAIVFVP